MPARGPASDATCTAAGSPSKAPGWSDGHAGESVQVGDPRTRVGALRDRVAARRGTNIGKVAAARLQMEYVFYALRDGHVRALRHPRREAA